MAYFCEKMAFFSEIFLILSEVFFPSSETIPYFSEKDRDCLEKIATSSLKLPDSSETFVASLDEIVLRLEKRNVMERN